jgi:hypothetical protein
MRSDVINEVFKQIRLSQNGAPGRKFGGSASIFRIRQTETDGLNGSEDGDIISLLTP